MFNVRSNSGKGNVFLKANMRYTNSYYSSDANPAYGGDSVYNYYEGGNYQGTGTDFNDPGSPGDGEWHYYEWHVKINSAKGVPDGVLEVWYDGTKLISVSNLAWWDNDYNDDGTWYRRDKRGWNCIMLGGNNFNVFSTAQLKEEQWYAIDDLVISTSYIGSLPAAPADLRIVE
jgi:hypothetical protein